MIFNQEKHLNMSAVKFNKVPMRANNRFEYKLDKVGDPLLWPQPTSFAFLFTLVSSFCSSNNDIFACPLGKVMTAAVQEFNSIPSFGNPFGTTDPKTENPILVDIPGPWEVGFTNMV